MARAPTQVWIVDHDPAARWDLESALTREGVRVRVFNTAETVIGALQTDIPRALVTEIHLPALTGLELLKFVRETYIGLPVIVTSERADLKSAIAAYRNGAFEYLPKPFDVDEATLLIIRAADVTPQLVRGAEVVPQVPEILGQAPAMQQVYRAIGRLARSSVTVLITGESGTGKELVARAVHHNSPRATRPFVAVNTAAIPTDLLESELFGHEKGAFTGAATRRWGRFEQADGGTLFLDEIGDMPMPMQTRLLRALSEGEFYRVGAQTPTRANVRVIAATHRDLEQSVQLGSFRGDLYYRLNVIRIDVPPLRARAEDIHALLTHYSQAVARDLGVDPKLFSPQAINKLADYAWPGNVRELVNLCRRVCVLAPGNEVRVEDLPPEILSSSLQSSEATWKDALAQWADLKADAGVRALMDEAKPEFERILMRAALEHTRGRKRDAARLMGWGRNTLARKLKTLGIGDDHAPI
jgi:two-component system nitrogen regulation response regulator GlnG